MRRIVLASGLFVALACLCLAAWAALTWTFETVHSTYRKGLRPAIAVDAEGNPHISYYDDVNDDLWYAVRSDGAWSAELVDSTGDVGVYSSIAVDSAGNPHIMYDDRTVFNDLKYAHHDGSAWTIETINDFGNRPCLALDSADRPRITNSRREYIAWNGTSWTEETVGTAGQCGHRGLALTSDDRPCMVYWDRDTQSVGYAEWDGTAWQYDTVSTKGTPTTFAQQVALALDSNDQPHIVYGDLADDDVLYAVRNGTNWVIETVYTEGDSDSQMDPYGLALGPDDVPHVTWEKGTTAVYATRVGGTWSTDELEGPYWHYEPDVAVDRWGYPHLAYRKEDMSDNWFPRYATGYNPLAVRWPR